jgi:LmbE family N-acetylglucosaminyl deacetylase
MKLLISPHNDDAELFAAFTMLREKPTVLTVTDSFIQFERGDDITWMQRRQESKEAALTLGCEVEFGGIPDTQLTADALRVLFRKYQGYETVYAPAIQGGNWQHDMISNVAQEMFQNVILYTTYTKSKLHTTGSVEIVPTAEEIDLKNQALFCYQSQLRLPATRPHFNAVIDKPEYYV